MSIHRQCSFLEVEGGKDGGWRLKVARNEDGGEWENSPRRLTSSLATSTNVTLPAGAVNTYQQQHQHLSRCLQLSSNP